MGSRDHPGSGQYLGLMKTEYRDAIGVRIVVGNRERLNLVALISDVVPCNPLSRAAKGLPVAEMKPRLQRTEIRLAARLKPAAGRAAVQ